MVVCCALRKQVKVCFRFILQDLCPSGSETDHLFIGIGKPISEYRSTHFIVYICAKHCFIQSGHKWKAMAAKYLYKK